MSDRKIKPFDSFTTAYKILIWAGFNQLSEKPKNKYIWICYQMYRIFAFLVIVVFNIQHIIFIKQRFNSLDDVFDSLMIEIPQLILLVKFLTFNLQITRINEMNKVVNGPMFRGNSKQDDMLLLKNNKNMRRLYNMINIGVAVTGVFWLSSLLIKRYQDPNSIVPAYMPFATDTWFKFLISAFLQPGLLLWVGFGHQALDFVVSAFYAQAEVQLKIIKYNFENLFNTQREVKADNNKFQYKDEMDPNLMARFVYYVHRLEKVAWLVKEINEVFSPAIFFQFLASSVSLCCVVYMISFTPVGMVLLFMVFVLFFILTQVFLYCYFGTLVNYESQSIVRSMYLSDWVSLSPKFRRLVLLAMSRWTRELTPRVSGLIPLSLSTFVSIVKTAYSLYTVLGTRN